MKTLLRESDRDQAIERVGNLQSTDSPIAGTLTAPHMLCHIADQLAIALGEIASETQTTWVMQTFVKWFTLYAPVPIPFGRISTTPEMLTTQPSNWDADLKRFNMLVDRFIHTVQVAPHAVFGRLSHREWGILSAKHIGHHLRQFGR